MEQLMIKDVRGEFFSNNSGNGSENCSDSTSQELRRNMVIIRGSVGSLSLITCVIAIALFLCYLRLLRRFTYRLALYLVVSAMFYSIVAVFAFEEMGYDPLSSSDVLFCKAAGFLLQYSDWIKLILTTITTFHLFFLIVLDYNLYKKLGGLKLEIGYVIFSVVFPLLFIWYPFFNNTYGQAGAWCWIMTKNDNCKTIEAGKIEQLAIWYGPFSFLLLIDTVVIVVIVGVLVTRIVRDRYNRSHPGDPARTLLLNFGPTPVNNKYSTIEHQQVLKLSLPLLLYPIVYQILSFFAVADRLYRIVNNEPLLGLWITHAIASASRGFFAGGTLILHLCLLRSKRSGSKSYPATPQQRSAAEPQVRVNPDYQVTSDGNKTKNSQKSERSALQGRRSIPTTTHPPSLVAVSEGRHTTQPWIPPESEVDRAVLEPSALHHGDNIEVHSNGESIKRMHPVEEEGEVYNALERSFSGAGDAAVNTAMEITTSGRQGGIEKLESVLDGGGYGTSDAAVTSDEEVTRFKPPRESVIDKATLQVKQEGLLDKCSRTTAAITTNDEEATKQNPLLEEGSDKATQQLDKVESLLDEGGYASSDTAVTSDEEVTTHKYPRESEVDKAVLHGKSK